MWVDSCIVDLDRVRAGVRANTRSVAEGVAAGLAARAVDDPRARRNFSLLLAQSPTRAHLLYWGGCVAAKSFDPDRIVRALVDHLAAHLPPPEGLVWISSRAFVHEGRAVLLPTPLADDLRIVDRQLRLEGYVALDSPRALVDLATGELVVTDLLGPDWAALSAAVEGANRRREEPTVAYGRYPIERWVFIDYSGRWGRISRATATRAAVLEVLDGLDRPTGDLLAHVASLFTRIDAWSVFPDRPKTALRAAFGDIEEG